MTPNHTLQRPKPVLMIPIRRCGSHALRLRLNFSPDFYSPYPLHIVDFMPLVKMYGDLANDYNYFQLVIDLIGLQNATMVKWENVALDPVSIFEVVKNRPRSIHSIAWEMLFQAGQKHDARVVMDKSLDNVHYAEELVSLFDDMLFLNVVRDPRAQVHSINRAIIHDFDILLNTLNWVKAHDTARVLAQKYPDKVLTIRYEDFLMGQEAVLRKICHFLGIEFLDSMLDVSSSQEANNISNLSTLWETNSCPPIPAYIDKFKASMTMEEIETIETLAGNHMDYYGYEKMTPAKAQLKEEMLETAKQQSEIKKKQAWTNLQADAPQDYQLRKFRTAYLTMLQERLLQDDKCYSYA
jgi:hypothetical protein